MDDPLNLVLSPSRTSDRPLHGRTVLLVEDSRCTCDAIRLMCQKSGARLRRADCLTSAHRHLKVYRPTVVIADVGLPDGSGLDLICTLSRATPRVEVLLAMSGDSTQHHPAKQAGADGFISKPVNSLLHFQQTILKHLDDTPLTRPILATNDKITPGDAAFRDDMYHVAKLLSHHQDGPVLYYVVQFLGSVAQTMGDQTLLEAAMELSSANCADADERQIAIDQVISLVKEQAQPPHIA